MYVVVALLTAVCAAVLAQDFTTVRDEDTTYGLDDNVTTASYQDLEVPFLTEEELKKIEESLKEDAPLEEPKDEPDEPFEGRILGGTAATAGQFPYVVYVKSTLADATTLDCGGVLISSTYVVTSAQCVVLAASIKVNAGSLDAATDVSVSAGTAIVYPAFRRYSLVHDIALVKLLVPLTLSSTVSPIKLATAQQSSNPSGLDYYTVRLLGWGPATTAGPITTALTYVDMVTMPKATCDEKMLELWVAYPVTMGCVDTATSTKGFCFGDKGGPVTYTFPAASSPSLVGIMSDFTACPSAYPDAFTRIGPYISWIKIYAKNLLT